MTFFKISDIRYQSYKKRIRPVCPDCVSHLQGEPGEVNDCKNEFHYPPNHPYSIERKNTIYSQCCCWSLSHGAARPPYYHP